MKFRKRVKLFPGVHLNFSSSGISTTVGIPGLSLNFSNKGTYLNTGIPGTGLYDRQKIGGGNERRNRISSTEESIPSPPVYPPEERGAIKTEQAEGTTTERLLELKKMLLDCYQLRNELLINLPKARKKWRNAELLMVVFQIMIVGFFIKWFRRNRDQKKEQWLDMREQLENCFVSIDIDIEKEILERYASLVNGYKTLLTCNKIWDVTSSTAQDRVATRSAAALAITRSEVKFYFKNIDIIRSKYNALHFENANGGDLYIYPPFIAIVSSEKKFGLIDIGELDFSFYGQRFIEEEKVPNDATVVDNSWAKVNKDGTPDRRFKGNYQIPVCKYGEMKLTSATGLNEAYSFSSYDKSEPFGLAMLTYQEFIRTRRS